MTHECYRAKIEALKEKVTFTMPAKDGSCYEECGTNLKNQVCYRLSSKRREAETPSEISSVSQPLSQINGAQRSSFSEISKKNEQIQKRIVRFFFFEISIKT